MLGLGGSSRAEHSPEELLAAAETHWEQLIVRCASSEARSAAKTPEVAALCAAFRSQFADIDVAALDEDADLLSLSPTGSEWTAVADVLSGAGFPRRSNTGAPALLRLDASLAYTAANSALSYQLCCDSIEATRTMELRALTVQSVAKAELGVVGELKTALMCAFDAMQAGRVVDIEDGGPEGVQRSALAALGGLRGYTAAAGRRRCRRSAAGRASSALDKIEIAAIAKAKLTKLVNMLAKIGLGNDDSVLLVSDAVGRAAAELVQLWGTTQSILGRAATVERGGAGCGLSTRFEATLWSFGERVAGCSPTLQSLTAQTDGLSRAEKSKDADERSGVAAAPLSGVREVRTAEMERFARWIATPRNESTLGAIDWPVSFGGVRGTAVATDVAAGEHVFRASHRVLLTPLHALRCGAACLRDTQQGHAFCTTHAEVGMLTLTLLFERRAAVRHSAERAAHSEVLAAVDALGSRSVISGTVTLRASSCEFYSPLDVLPLTSSWSHTFPWKQL